MFLTLARGQKNGQIPDFDNARRRDVYHSELPSGVAPGEQRVKFAEFESFQWSDNVPSKPLSLYLKLFDLCLQKACCN
jgi:hypothetical protein